MSKMHLFTSESVSEGHPDKMADQISDAILDAIIERDSDCRVACETMTNTGLILLGQAGDPRRVDRIGHQVLHQSDRTLRRRRPDG